MTLVNKGAICDICGEMIDEPKIQPVTIKGIPKIFHVHKLTPWKDGIICEDILKRTAREKNWRLLPDCMLKEAYRGMIEVQKLLDMAEREGGEKEVLKVAADILKNV